MNIKTLFFGFGLLSITATVSATDPVPLAANKPHFRSEPPASIHNRKLTVLSETNRNVFRLDARRGDGMAWWPETRFTNGTIEFEVRGTNAFQKSFVGVAFHGQDEKTYDAVYFRPFNFLSTEPLRRRHGVQYVAHPAHTWNTLRDTCPGQFEHEVSPAPIPDGWFQVRIKVNHPTVRVFVGQSAEPVLEVNQLSDRKSGWVGLWVGNESGGDFADLKISPAP